MRAARPLILAAVAAFGSAVAQPQAGPPLSGRAPGLPSPEEGRPFYQQGYGWEQHGQHSQNWAAVQDRRGVVFVANTNGVLEFDASTWRFHPLPEGQQQAVRSLAVDGAGQVFVGGVGEIGVMRADSVGRLRYTSLLPYLPHAARAGLGDVWTTHVARDGVYFQTSERLLRWDGRRMHAWASRTRFHKAFEVGGTCYVREEGVGLRRVVGSRLVTVPGGEWFAERKLDALALHPRGVLAVVRDEGLVLWQQGRSRPLGGEASAYLRQYRPYNAVAIANPYGGRGGRLYAIATFGGGVLVVDEAGRAVRVYKDDVGLTDADLVLHAAADHQGGLWLALNNGIRRFDALTTLTRFEPADGLLGSVYDVGRVGGVLHAATSSGLFRLEPGRHGLGDRPEGRYARFVPVPGLPPVQAWAIAPTGSGLLAATNDGVFDVGPAGTRLVQRGQTFSLYRSKARPGRIYVGRKDGLGVLVRGAKGWQDGGLVGGVRQEVRKAEEDAEGNLWLAPIDGGLLRVRLGADGVSPLAITAFGPRDGLPEGTSSLVRLGDRLLVLTRAGVLSVHAEGAATRFVPEPALAHLRGNYWVSEVQNGRFWVWSPDGLAAFRAGRGGKIEEATPLGLRLRGLQSEAIHEEPDGTLWIGTESGLVRFDAAMRRPPAPFPALIRAVQDHRRAPIFGGAWGAGVPGESAAREHTLPYAQNDLRFVYAAPAFNRHDLTEYQVRLDGHDDDWTPWAPETVAEYTNLHERAYALRVRARDVGGTISAQGVYYFRVQPPWYRTWWAYTLYVALITALIAAGVLWRLRQHRLQSERERILNLRLDRMNARLGQTNRRLRAADKLKDDLLANTSHELRTPLTAILGFSSLLAEEAEEESRDLARIIHRSGQRLLHTVNDLLDLAKLRASRVELAPHALDVAETARGVVEMLGPLAADKGLWLRLDGADAPLPALLDPYGLERVLTNLVGNAIKFTEAGGVTLRLDAAPDVVVIEVADTGIGMSAEFLPHLFEEFKQESSGYARSHEGTGLGLSIVRRVVTLMRGTIAVESRPAAESSQPADRPSGTTFEVRLPRDARRHALVSGDGAPATPAEPALDGVRVLGVEVPDAARGALRAALGAGATLHFTDSLDEAVRRASVLAYDVVVAGEPPVRGIRPAVVLRHLPGYHRVPTVALVAGEPDAAALDALRGLGYELHLALPLEPGPILDAFEDLLTREEYLEAR